MLKEPSGPFPFVDLPLDLQEEIMSHTRPETRHALARTHRRAYAKVGDFPRLFQQHVWDPCSTERAVAVRRAFLEILEFGVPQWPGADESIYMESATPLHIRWRRGTKMWQLTIGRTGRWQLWHMFRLYHAATLAELDAEVVKQWRADLANV
jgi:hypothetical protein